MASTRSSTALLLALAAVWGSSWIADEVLRTQGDPVRLTGERYLIAGVFLGLILVGRKILRRTRPGPASDRSWIGINLVLGLTMFTLPFLLLVWADAHGVAAWTPLIYSALPLLLLLSSGELRTPAILGIGAMLVALNGSLSFSGARLGWVLLVVAAVALQGWSLLYVRRHLAEASSLRGVTAQMLTAGFLLLMGAPHRLAQPAWSLPSLGALAALAGLATALAYPLYYRLLRTLEPAQIATTAWLQTLVALGESALLMHLRPGWPLIAAALVILGCTVSMLRDEPQSPELALPFRSQL